MGKPIGYLAAFVGGAAVGSVATWFLMKNALLRLLAEKEEERRGSLEETKEALDAALDISIEKEETPSTIMTTYAEKVKQYYPPEPEEDDGSIMVIAPDEYGDDPEYEKVTLIYYADGILAEYWTKEEVDDIDEVIGHEALGTFGTYEDDAVYVRNDSKQCYYEVLKDADTYANVLRSRPRPVELND